MILLWPGPKQAFLWPVVSLESSGSKGLKIPVTPKGGIRSIPSVEPTCARD